MALTYKFFMTPMCPDCGERTELKSSPLLNTEPTEIPGSNKRSTSWFRLRARTLFVVAAVLVLVVILVGSVASRIKRAKINWNYRELLWSSSRNWTPRMLSGSSSTEWRTPPAVSFWTYTRYHGWTVWSWVHCWK